MLWFSKICYVRDLCLSFILEICPSYSSPYSMQRDCKVRTVATTVATRKYCTIVVGHYHGRLLASSSLWNLRMSPRPGDQSVIDTISFQGQLGGANNSFERIWVAALAVGLSPAIFLTVRNYLLVTKYLCTLTCLRSRPPLPIVREHPSPPCPRAQPGLMVFPADCVLEWVMFRPHNPSRHQVQQRSRIWKGQLGASQRRGGNVGIW